MVFHHLNNALYYLEFAEEYRRLTSSLKNEIGTLKVELRFLKTYLLCMKLSKNASFVSSSRSISLISSIEAASWEINVDLYSNLSRTSTMDDLARAVHRTAAKIKQFEPNIKEDFRMLLNQHWWPSSTSANYSSLDSPAHEDFCDFVLENLSDVVESKSLILSLNKQIEVLAKKLKFLKNQISGTSWGDSARQVMGSFLQYVLFVVTGAACLSYLCWVDEMDEMEIKFSDLQQKIKPDTVEVMGMHVELLKAPILTRSLDAETQAVSFVKFLIENSINFMNDQTAIISEEMVFLMTFVIDLPIYQCRGDSKRISDEIKAVAKEAGIFEYNFLVNEVTEDQIREMNDVFSRLLERMKLIKAEVLLMQLQKSHDTSVSPLKDRMLALHEGLKFLRPLLDEPLEEKTEEKKQFREDVAAVTYELMSHIYTLHENKKNQERIREVDLPLFVLMEKIKLIRGEVQLMELKDRNAEVMVLMKDQIVALHEAFKYLRAFLMDTSKMEEDTEDGKLFLKHFEAVTRESLSFILPICTNEMANEGIDEANLQSLKLLEKINLVKAEIFLADLLSREAALMVHMKDQVQTLQEGAIFLRNVIMDPPKEFKEFGELMWMKIEAVANEATSLVFLFYENVRKEDMSMEMNLLLSGMIEKIMLLKAEIKQMYLQIPRSYPKIDELGYISSLLGNLREQLKHNFNSITSANHHLDSVCMDLEFLRSFLIKSVNQHTEHEALKVLGTSIKLHMN